jgi:acetylornithine/succinyldiaminopimelate/putrescine aminotransferase
LPTYARVDVAFERCEGAWLIATNGERYLDFTGGVAVNALGHAHPYLMLPPLIIDEPEIAEAIHRIDGAAARIEFNQRERAAAGAKP